MRHWRAALFILLFFAPAQGFAAIHRFALVVGNNQGDGRDVTLQYAESDASKVARVLRDLGDFEPANIVLLRGEDSRTVRSSLIALNDRIRSVQSSPSDQAMLFVYYSGHADGQSLRLGASRLRFMELSQLVRGSSAAFRLLVVDACRSGTLTRVKGGRKVSGFDIQQGSRLPGEGMAFLTASSANEDAQESDEIKGSFFTHALVSGLLGAADRDGDGKVDLDEAYSHARDATIRATSRTFAGTQHPTFQFKLRGQDSLVLTRLNPGRGRSQVVFPEGLSFLVMAKSSSGAVVGELGASGSARQLSLRPGRYFVRGRGKNYLLEGTISVASGQTRAVTKDELSKAEFAQLVRKGTALARMAHSVDLGFSLRSSLSNASTPCVGAQAGYRLALRALTLGTHLGYCRAGFESEALTARTSEFEWTVRVERVWDVNRASVQIGVGGGPRLSYQSFETLGIAPPRWSVSPLAFLSIGGSYPLSRSVFVALNARAEGHLFSFQEDALSDPALQAEFAVRGGASVGVRF